MRKFVIGSMFILFFCAITVTVLFCSRQDVIENRYEKWIKTLVKQYPRSLDEGDSVFNWWPLSSNPIYRYRIVKSKWSFGDKWLGKEFTLKVKQEKDNSNNFQFDVQGFDEFPYKGFVVKDNRIFILSGVERPFIVFPLFEHILFCNEDYEYQFLRDAVLLTNDEVFYAPLATDFWQVTEANGDEYRLEQLTPRGLYYVFEKGIGIKEWYIPGGYVVQLVDESILND